MEKQQILVINSGSSSLKISLFHIDNGSYIRAADAHLKKTNGQQVELEIMTTKGKECHRLAAPSDIADSLSLVKNTFRQAGYILSPNLRIGHRYVHGGNKYTSSVLITPEVIRELEKLNYLAPLHNEACLAGIKSCLDYFGPSVPQVAVFDTAFHSTMPPVASNYAIPNEIATKYPIKRYGFHGISHAYLSDTYSRHVGRNKQSKIITVHLGNGCSMTAIKGGVSVDTSMGFTPAEGLIMSTRAGDVDAAIVEFLCIHEKKTPTEIMQILNSQSGLLGVSGVSPDMKTLLNLSTENDKAALAIDMFCYRILKYLGSYIAALGGVEAIIFSGGIGENSPQIREPIARRLKWLGVKLDDRANQQAVKLLPGAIHKISAEDSAVALYVIATDENWFIAKEVDHILKQVG